MLKKSLLFAMTLLATCAMSFAQTRYVVWSGDALTADETQIATDWYGWWAMDPVAVDDATSAEGKSLLWKTNDGGANGSAGIYVGDNGHTFDMNLLAPMDLVFNAKITGSGTWVLRLTGKDTGDVDYTLDIAADGEWHEVRLNIEKCYNKAYEAWMKAANDEAFKLGYVFALVGTGLSADAAVYTSDIHYEATVAMPEITAEASNITDTSADITYAVTFPQGYTNTKVTVDGNPAEASATLNLTDLTPKTEYAHTIVAEGEIGGKTYKTEKVVSFTTLREAGDVSVFYGVIDGIAKQQENEYDVHVDYSIEYNSDKTLTIEATFDGLPAGSNHKVNLQNGDDLDNWKEMSIIEGEKYTYTSKGTFEEGALVNMFFWCEYDNGVFGGDYHILYTVGSENEKPTGAPRVKATVQNVTFNSAEIAYTLIPETTNGKVTVYYKPVDGEVVKATSNPIMLSGLTEMTSYSYEVYAVAEIDLNADGVITDEEKLESSHAKVEFKTPSENARDIVYADWANVEFKTSPVVYASLPWQVTYKADGTALYEIDLTQVDGKVPGLAPQIYWNGFQKLTKNAETGMYEYNFGAQELDATTAISHYLAYAGGVFDFRTPYTNWGMEQARPELGEAVSLALGASKSTVKAGEESVLSVVAKDAAGHYLPVDGVEFSVSPEGATIADFVFTANVKAEYEITAISGTMSAKTVITVFASPEANDLVSGKVGVTDDDNIIEDTKAEFATDGNEGTELRWGCGNTEEHYLIFDLANGEIPGYYIESVDLLFEGAYATDFTVTLSNARPSELDAAVSSYADDVEAAKEDVVFSPAVNGTHHIFVSDPEGYHRYVTLRTTKALNTDWGIKVKEMKVYGTQAKPVTPSGIENVTEDANAPVEYFNLNGIRVDNPENGLYIRRAGSKVEKVFIR